MDFTITTRSGKTEPVSFDKIILRLQELAKGLDESINPIQVAQKTIEGLYSGVTTSELDELSAQNAAAKAVEHPDYNLFAGRIAVSNLQKNITKSFSKTVKSLAEYIDPNTNEPASLVSDELRDIVKKHAKEIDARIVPERDFGYTYFGIKTLERAYLLQQDGVVAETPQYMFMRVSLGVHGGDIKSAFEMYDLMSQKYYKHATPTLYNAGTRKPQLSSCFLFAMEDDSIEGIYSTLGKIAGISKLAGGFGFSVHNVRSQGSYIKGTGGRSNGIVPMLKVFNETARYVDQGGGRRKGAFAAYIEPWHADIFEFLELKKNHGKEEMRARDLFYALWIPDLFMERVKSGGMWSLMDPAVSKNLFNVHSDAFKTLYEGYEKEGKFVKQIQARELWDKIVESQIETGTPYMLYKDACNQKSNQKNLGTIRSSNLCAEVVEYSDGENAAVCNLAAIVLPTYVKKNKKGEAAEFDFKKLYDVTRSATRNLDTVIDKNLYTIEDTRRSNNKNRPIGLGVNGLADVFALLGMPYDSTEARKLNREIFEAMYFAALSESTALAKEFGTYETYKDSPVAQGILQHDMWDKEKITIEESDRWDWKGLRKTIAKQGLRNSLLTALMPTASSSGMYGYHESFEPYNSNLYVRRTLSGEFIMINQHLVRDLIKAGMWTKEVKNKLMADNGSIQNIDGISDELKRIYRTVWEIPQKHIIEMAAERGAFVDQSQSMNIHMKDPTKAKITSMHFYGWEQGLKTGMYYLRTQAARDAKKFTVDSSTNTSEKLEEKTEEVTKLLNQNIKVIDDATANVCIDCSA